jgi:anti-anti-sigma regulatory factor
MNVKIDTKEKFTVLTPQVEKISANMTEDIEKLAGYAPVGIPHLVINMINVSEIAPEAAQKLSDVQQQAYEKDHSFVICEMQDAVEAVFDAEELTDMMNITPSESEAWDIVQMEEIERELMGDFDTEEKED